MASSEGETDEDAVVLAVARCADLCNDDTYRGITPEEISALEATGNLAEPSSWSTVRVHKSGPSLLEVSRRIVRCYFHGDVFLSGDLGGTVELENGVPHPQGLYDSTIADSVLGPKILIKNTQMLSNAKVDSGARIVGCGTVACTGPTTFGVGTEIRVGSEVSGRPIVVYPSITMSEVLPQALRRDYPAFSVEALVERVASLLKQVTCPRTLIGEGALLLNAPRVINSFLGPHAVVMDSSVEGSTVLSSAEEPSRVTGGAVLQGCVVQWGCHVEGGAIVKHSLLMEHSSVAERALVVHSVLCPDTGVALGECHHSLLGPFIGFHHLALAIALVWPQGRGNIAHGAKVGANHTGRVADQEALIGEGVFFGLGSSVKFPVDLTDSAYTLVAAGTALDPQRLHFPFSLVAESRESAPELKGLTQIRPGWILKHSPYTVLRNEDKYAKRSKARRHVLTERIVRPHTIRLMLEARQRLRAAVTKADAVFTQKSVPGLGGNLMTLKSAQEGVEAYTTWIERYALQGLLDRLTKKPVTDGAEWEFQCSLLCDELDCTQRVSVVLERLVALESTLVESVERCKARDDERGAAIIADYADTHTAAAKDNVVRAARQRLEQVRQEVQALSTTPVAGHSLREVLSAIPPAKV